MQSSRHTTSGGSGSGSSSIKVGPRGWGRREEISFGMERDTEEEIQDGAIWKQREKGDTQSSVRETRQRDRKNKDTRRRRGVRKGGGGAGGGRGLVKRGQGGG